MNHRAQQVLWGVLVAALVGITAASLWRGMDARLVGGSRGAAGGRVAGLGLLSRGRGAGEGDLAAYGRVPSFTLTSQTGDPVTLAALKGQIWIADFFFTSCSSSCPMMSAGMQNLQKALGDSKGVRLVSFSVDPERDTPEKLAEYARGYGATPDHWLFLTGDKKQVRRLAVEGFHVSAGDASPEDIQQGAETVLHSTRLALVDGHGDIRGYYDGTDAKALDQLGQDVRRLLSGSARR
jgi:cytochrome oxidase Cu insertion factor (SCO1/SenC/PrrC family)